MTDDDILTLGEEKDVAFSVLLLDVYSMCVDDASGR